MNRIDRLFPWDSMSCSNRYMGSDAYHPWNDNIGILACSVDSEGCKDVL